MCKVRKVDVFGVGASISIGITPCLTENELRDSWRKYRNELAISYQVEFISDFERWNFYLFYVVENKNRLDRSLKYEIEHDTVSSRKIIVDSSELIDDSMDSLIASYIKYEIKDIKQFSHYSTFEINEDAKNIVEDENR